MPTHQSQRISGSPVAPRFPLDAVKFAMSRVPACVTNGRPHRGRHRFVRPRGQDGFQVPRRWQGSLLLHFILLVYIFFPLFCFPLLHFVVSFPSFASFFFSPTKADTVLRVSSLPSPREDGTPRTLRRLPNRSSHVCKVSQLLPFYAPLLFSFL